MFEWKVYKRNEMNELDENLDAETHLEFEDHKLIILFNFYYNGSRGSAGFIKHNSVYKNEADGIGGNE